MGTPVMTESLHLTVELPPRPIGTCFPYSIADSGEAEIVGHRVIYDLDTQDMTVTYRYRFNFRGRSMTCSDMSVDKLERYLGGEG